MHSITEQVRTLPRHRSTGLQAVGFRKDGRPIWPVKGGAETEEEKKTREEKEAADAKAKDEKEKAEKPPWGDDESFDAETAWNLIKNLRAQKNDPEAAKRLKAAEDRVEELENEKKSDLEKANARAEKAEKALKERTDQETAAQLRKEVAEAKGVKPGVLSGTTREEIEASADKFVEEYPELVTKKAPPADGQGENGGSVADGKEMTADDVVAAAMKR
ncbi:MAG: hypothetical protein Q7V58_09490 [Actinomycetota bacterium]|nr:hypothetical protein [Actinomycetota bacterium]